MKVGFVVGLAEKLTMSRWDRTRSQVVISRAAKSSSLGPDRPMVLVAWWTALRGIIVLSPLHPATFNNATPDVEHVVLRGFSNG